MKHASNRTEPTTGPRHEGNGHFIDVRGVVKTFQTAAGPFTALKDVNLKVNRGEFVAVIGKSGSGKSTLLNMLTGIDRPTSGEVYVGDTALHTLSENQMARWRGREMGIIFQFFQLLPTLTLLENVMLPMDFCNLYTPAQRKKRAMGLLDLVEMGDQAHRLPSAVSGGQQQRVAIARALANNPPILVADEPTGNLDTKTAQSIFDLFEALLAGGKTIVMVTHDVDLARRVDRAVIVSDGEVIDEYVARAFPALTQEQLVWITREVTPQRHAPGAVIIREGSPPEGLYIVIQGRAEVVIHGPEDQEIVVAHMESGHYFGEIELVRGGSAIATVRAASNESLDVVAIDREAFQRMLAESAPTREAVERVVDERIAEHTSVEQARDPGLDIQEPKP